jgi:hypothetical protein
MESSAGGLSVFSIALKITIHRRLGMSDLPNELEPYKLRSRRHRNKAIKALEDDVAEQAAREFRKSREAMTEALQYLQDLGAPDPNSGKRASEGEIAIAEQLADCWGILGGVCRAQGDLVSAKDAYDNGYKYESSRRFNILNTYNRVNRLVVRILQNPELLSDPQPLVTDLSEPKKTMHDLLCETAEEIERQLREGRPDRAWALADLVMVRLLACLDGVDIALDALDKCSENDPFPYHSTLKVIRELAGKGLAMKEKLIAVGKHLRQKLPQTMQGDSLAPEPLTG